MKQKRGMDRRHFLKKSTFGMIGAGVLTAENCKKAGEYAKEEGKKSLLKVKDYRILGRTGFRVSDIGGGYIKDEGLMSAALDRGVNYIDTAEQYPGHHKIVGQAIKGRDRKSLFITSKLEVKKDKSKEGFKKRVQKALEEIGTDYIDCMMMHMPEKAEILGTEGFHAAMEELKTEGRVRFVGVSNHGSFWFRDPEETMEKVLLTAAEDGRFDVFLMAYNFLQMDQAESVLEVCRKRKIGTALMKTTPVAKYYGLKSRVEDLEKEGKDVHPFYKEGLQRFKRKADQAENFIQKYDLQNPEEIKEAAIRFVLDNPNVNTVCCSMNTFDDLEKFVGLSGTNLRNWDKEKLAAYREGCGQLYCRHACGVCELRCPEGVPVNTIMRYNHYFLAQRREKEAMRNYNNISGPKADVCSQCPGYCEKACPYGVPIQGMLFLAHDLLSLESSFDA
ncbi:MAG: aldo/keto reductase [Candidatus Aminicenantes bacterium]|jgi:predicted aldo/keto reductase-like oxidoreductase